jgi:hypothetical protein
MLDEQDARVNRAGRLNRALHAVMLKARLSFGFNLCVDDAAQAGA